MSEMGYNLTLIKMKITFLDRYSPTELRTMYPNSMFLDSYYDQFIMGVHKESESIIYNLSELIDSIVKEEYPNDFDLKDSMFYGKVYEFISNYLDDFDGIDGIDGLVSFCNGETKHGLHTLPYTLMYDSEIQLLIEGLHLKINRRSCGVKSNNLIA